MYHQRIDERRGKKINNCGNSLQQKKKESDSLIEFIDTCMSGDE